MKFTRSEIKRILPIARRRIGNAIVSWVQRLFANRRLAKDVFGCGYQQRALICYLPEAFDGALPKSHSNFTECHTAAMVFHRLGYRVDCASRDNDRIDYSDYDVVYGITSPAYARSFATGAEPLRIFYSVGAHTFLNFKVTAERNLAFFAEHGSRAMSSCHYVPGNGMNYYNAYLSDAVICLGDASVAAHFEQEDPRPGRYYSLPAFYFDMRTPSHQKDFDRCRKNLLWFGSSGLIHKGLDIAIDFAVKHPEYTLHICGASRGEKEFWRHYAPIADKAPNIVQHGFVDIASTEFADILDQCAILVNPSLSESGAVAVLNVLANGLLYPVYSHETGLAIADYGSEVPSVDYTMFEKDILDASSKPAEELLQTTRALNSHVRENYSLAQYEERLYNHIETILKNKNRR
ncbi:MAG: glycosyltransferase [Bacteroidaceae bacterium]|nr:glycosyltransferase [Bacteroidaceae bacterium]